MGSSPTRLVLTTIFLVAVCPLAVQTALPIYYRHNIYLLSEIIIQLSFLKIETLFSRDNTLKSNKNSIFIPTTAMNVFLSL